MSNGNDLDQLLKYKGYVNRCVISLNVSLLLDPGTRSVNNDIPHC